MQRKITKKAIAFALALVMIIGMMPMNALAYESETHEVFKSTETTIAPGITQKVNYAYAKDGKQMVYYVATADLSRDDVVVQTSYYKQHEDGAMGMAKLTDQMAYAKEKYSNPDDEHFISEYYTPVVGVNGSFYNMSTGQPTGTTYIDGVSFGTKSYDNFFAILKDGTAVIDYRSNEGNYTGEKAIMHAVAGSQWLVRDGKDVTANISGSYNTDRHCRTCVGVTADGKVVLMSLDGRQEPFSCGGSMHELAQIMLEQGCVAAVNLDGGGSTTFVSRPEGEEEIQIINRPSDGSERAISAGLIIATTTAPTNVFDHANLSAENDYVTPYSEVEISAIGVSTTNNSADIPEDAVLQLADSKYGTIEDGIFKSNGTAGDVVIEMIYDGKSVGSTTVHVVIPDLKFDSESMVVPYNKTFKLKVSGTTNNGMNKVVLKDSDFVFELSDAKMGTIDGAYYTSCDADAGVTSGTITVKCAYDETKKATTSITFGKASVIVEDFEDQDITGWSAKSAYAGRNHPVYGRFESYDLNLVDANTGKVRNGEYALEITADFSTTTASGYKAIKYTLPAIDLTGATSFGMWMYLPVEDVHNLEFDIGGYEYYIEDDENVDEEGWYYVSAPVATVGSSVSTFAIYMTDPDETYFNIFNTFKIYVDDLTIDYSNATEDRENPSFSEVKIVNGLDSTVNMDGQTLTENTITVRAKAEENFVGNYTGLDITTAKVFVDNVELDKTQYVCDETGMITVGDITLSNGTHSFRFEISDNSGNTGIITRKVIINEENGDVSVVRRSNEALPLAGSVEYFDVIAKNIETVEAITMEIDLDTLNIWELEGADVTYGYEMEYSIDDRSNTAFIKLTKTGDVEITGEAIIASLPVRVWQTTSYLQDKYIDAGAVSNSTTSNESNVISTPYVMWQTDRTRLVRIEFEVIGATVEYSNGATNTFASEQMNIITELNRYRTNGYYNEAGEYVKGDTTFCKQGKECTHLHTAEAIEDKAATCTEAGYTGRTFCEECDSVVEWGTIEKATGHAYDFVDGVLKCTSDDCDKTFTGTYTDGKEYVDGIAVNGWVGERYYVDGLVVTGIYAVDGVYYDFGDNGVSKGKYTGLVTIDEKYYFAKLGVLSGGWFQIGDDWYYFDEETLTTVEEKTFTYEYGHQATYQFYENGKIVSGAWVELDLGTRYYYGPAYYKLTAKRGNAYWVTIDGNKYAFDGMGFRHEGMSFIVESNNPQQLMVFSDEGVYQEIYTGMYEGKYYENGYICPNKGLIEYEGDYYYIISGGKTYVGTLFVTEAKTNGLVEPKKYTFAEDGKMVIEPAKNGIVDGKYYVDDEVVTGAGMVKVDGDLYFVTMSGKVYKDGTLAIGEAKANGLVKPGKHTFGADGKMIIEPAKNGIVDGKYYVDDEVVTGAGMVEVDGDLYFITMSGKVYTNGTLAIGEAKANGLVKPGKHTFGADGKKVIEPVKNGIVDGKYYVNDELITGAGVVEVDGALYFITASGKVYVGSISIGEAKANGLVDAGSYKTDASGKLIIE